ncbi:MAG: transposase, partial [Anaerolineae bacterium]
LPDLDIAGESTNWYWWHFPSTSSGRRFWQAAHDPELAVFDPQLFLVNPKLIKWFKKTFPEEEKCDERDPFFIGEYARTRRLTPYQFQEPVLRLRIYTRHHFHLVQSLARTKTYFLAYLFLKASAYQQLQPFSDVFGVTSSHILERYSTLDQIAGFPTQTLADSLQALASGHLPDPMGNAITLKQVGQRSWPLPDALVEPVHRILTLTLEHIRFLEHQIQRVEAWIHAEARSLPDVAWLMSIPGIGLVLATTLVAEIGDVQRFLEGEKWDKKRKRWRKKNAKDGEAALAKHCGLWWSHSSSGDFDGDERHLVKAGNRYARYAFVQGAFSCKNHEPEYVAYYAKKYRQSVKHKHRRALILTARKLVGLVFALLRKQAPYQPPEVRNH